MERIADAAVAAELPTGRVISEVEMRSMLRGIRLARAILNQLEDIVEDIYMNRMSIPLDNKPVIVTEE